MCTYHHTCTTQSMIMSSIRFDPKNITFLVIIGEIFLPFWLLTFRILCLIIQINSCKASLYLFFDSTKFLEED